MLRSYFFENHSNPENLSYLGTASLLLSLYIWVADSCYEVSQIFKFHLSHYLFHLSLHVLLEHILPLQAFMM